MHNVDAAADFTGTKGGRRVGVSRDSSASTATFFNCVAVEEGN